MKKLFLLFALLCLCLVICACRAEEREEAKTQDSKVASSTQQTQESQETSAELEQPLVDPVDYDLRSIEEYQAFIDAQSNLPGDFVSFDDLKQFGEFRSFYCSHSIKEAGIDFTWYHYTLVDESGYILRIAIDHTPEEQNISTVYLQSLSPDARVVDNGKGVRHTYLADNLLMIQWKSQGIGYTLSADSGALKDYPAESSTLVSKLLDPNTAADALGELFELETQFP